MTSFANLSIAEFYKRLPPGTDKALLSLRDLIFRTATSVESIGEIEESLKWGTPSYATVRPASGTPVRLSPSKNNNYDCEISVHCQSTLIADFREVYPNLDYDRNRSLLIKASDISTAEVKHFVQMALTYHHRRKHGVGI